VIPAINDFWKNRYIITIGIEATKIAVNNILKLEKYSPR
jgi:hypothetical protein